tara:strand:+ start:1518 stop:3281 length:1764 start_codon:yes stop_codon:yes gene_type:complete
MTIRFHLLPHAPSKEEKELFTSGMRGENVNNKRVTKRFENLLGRRAGGGAFAEGNTARRNNNITSSSSILARMNPFNSDENNASCLVSCEGLKGSLRFSKIDFDDNSIVRKYQLKVYDDDKDDDKNEEGDEEKKISTKKRVVNARDIAHFEFIDDNQIVFAQRNSKNILYAELTKAVHSPSQVYLFGKHESPVSCLAVNANSKIDVVASGATDGSLFVHTIKDGKKVGSCRRAHDGEGGTKCVSVVRKKKEEEEDDGDIIVASGGADGIVRIWIVDSENIRLKMLCRLDNGVAPISCVSLKYYTSSSSPLSFARVFVGSSNEGTFRVWKSTQFKVGGDIKNADWSVELLQNAVSKRLRGNFNNSVDVESCSVSEDGKFVAFSSNGINSESNVVEKSILQVMRLKEHSNNSKEKQQKEEKWVTQAATEDLGPLCGLHFLGSHRLFAPSKENGVPRILDENLKPSRVSSADGVTTKPVARAKPLPHLPHADAEENMKKKKASEIKEYNNESEGGEEETDDEDERELKENASASPPTIKKLPYPSMSFSPTVNLEDIWNSSKREPRVCDTQRWSPTSLLLKNAHPTRVDY